MRNAYSTFHTVCGVILGKMMVAQVVKFCAFHGFMVSRFYFVRFLTKILYAFILYTSKITHPAL